MLQDRNADTPVEGTDNEPQTLYFTLSLYADQDRVRKAFGAGVDTLIDPGQQIDIQSRYNQSLNLRDAIEPLLNDITDRERESRIEDFFLSSSSGLTPETIDVTIPAGIDWTTEGIRFSAKFDGKTSKTMKVRTFWYVHSNGAVSYHMSFICRYDHKVRDFYFLSMLQKVCAPKEFKREAATGPGNKARQIDFLDTASGIFPLDSVKVTPHGTPAADASTFWNYVKQRYNEHARDLFQNGATGIAIEKSDYFKDLIGEDDFIEVPGLSMPRARYMFLFDDETFFNALGREEKGKIKDNKECIEIAKLIGAMIKKAKTDHSSGKTAALAVTLDEAFLSTADRLAVALRYYFLSGFCQNIIDFMNQDASEIRDSLDPIYPTTAEQEEENFFFRFANPRSMTQIVPGSRSLNIGNDFIGTCPYAFLIHVASLHNEFLTRSYERKVATLKKYVERKIGIASSGAKAIKDYAGAAQAFYEFRTRTLADYIRYRYENVFRYDTEGDCFTSLEKVRGISRKTAYLNEMVANLQSTTRDLEERQRRDDTDQRDQDNRLLNVLVAAIGFASILQVWFQIVESLSNGFLKDIAHMGLVAAISQWRPGISVFLLLISMVLFFLSFLGAVILLIRKRRDLVERIRKTKEKNRDGGDEAEAAAGMT